MRNKHQINGKNVMEDIAMQVGVTHQEKYSKNLLTVADKQQ